MSFADNLRPISCHLSKQGHAIGLEFEPFDLLIEGESNEQEEPELILNCFQLPTSDLSRLANNSFPVESISDRCEGSIYLTIQMIGEHYWVDLLRLEFGDVNDKGLETRIHVRFTDLYFLAPSCFEHTFETIMHVV